MKRKSLTIPILSLNRLLKPTTTLMSNNLHFFLVVNPTLNPRKDKSFSPESFLPNSRVINPTKTKPTPRTTSPTNLPSNFPTSPSRPSPQITLSQTPSNPTTSPTLKSTSPIILPSQSVLLAALLAQDLSSEFKGQVLRTWLR